MAAKVTSKGQITIPKRVREALGLKAGSRVEFAIEEGRAVLTAVSGGIDALYGSLNRYLPKGKRLPDGVMEQVRLEVAHAAALEGRHRRHKRSS
jgi:AbrB family looped-hinge helix DNA binding protein